MRKFIRLTAILLSSVILVRAPAYAAGADRNSLNVKGTPQRNAGSALTTGQRGIRKTQEAPGNTGTAKTSMAGDTSKTVGGRNLQVASINPQNDNQITIKKVPVTSHLPNDILSLPDNGREIKELVPTPGGNSWNGKWDMDPDIEKDIKKRSVTSPRYPYVLIYGNVSDSEFSDFTQYMDRLIKEDPGLVNEAVNRGWKIVLTSCDLDGLIFDWETDGIEGCTYFPPDGGSGTVYIHAGDYSYCLLHEFGHVLDSISGYPSQTEFFNALYNKESGNLTEYGSTSELEFFAEVYMNSMLQPESTLAACRDAVSYVSEYRDAINKAAS